MSLYRYRAVDGNGELVEGAGSGASRDDVVAELQGRGWLPLEVEPAGTAYTRRGGSRQAPRWFGAARRGGAQGIAGLTRQLAVLVQSGLPLDRSLEILLELERDGPNEQPVGEVGDGIRSGQAFSEALAARPDLFTPLYVSLVRAGEASGALGQVLGELAAHLERVQDLRSRIRSALIYPALLLTVAVLSILVLLTWVVPRFEAMFADLGATMPLPTRVVIGAGNLLADGWPLLLATAVAAVLLVRYLLRLPAIRARWDALLLEMPGVRALVSRLQVARFARTLGTLLRNGIPLVEALALAADTLSNRVLARAIQETDTRLRHGETLADAIAGDGARMPALVTHMVRVGEETGRLDEMLLRLAEIYERESEAAIQRYVAVLEPVLILVLGVLIGGIVLSILLAILSLNTMQF